jgi:hypothetical protein
VKHNRSRHKVVVFSAASIAIAVSLLSLVYGALTSISVADDQAPESRQDGPPSLPPLIIDKNAPLLLDAPKEGDAAKLRPYLRINASCYVCHDNYKSERLAVIHAKEEIGCADCHGKSLEHQNDEDNITPPEIMFPLAKIDGLCAECHDSHDVSARKVLTRWSQRCPEKTEFDEVVCTDCHGYHRLEKRIVRWDKETGDVIVEARAEQSDR